LISLSLCLSVSLSLSPSCLSRRLSRVLALSLSLCLPISVSLEEQQSSVRRYSGVRVPGFGGQISSFGIRKCEEELPGRVEESCAGGGWSSTARSLCLSVSRCLCVCICLSVSLSLSEQQGLIALEVFQFSGSGSWDSDFGGGVSGFGLRLSSYGL
jgi:hypothetical protein